MIHYVIVLWKRKIIMSYIQMAKKYLMDYLLGLFFGGQFGQ